MHILVAAFLAVQAKEETALKPLCEVAKRLDEGIKLFLNGKDMKEAFKSWDAGETREEVAKKLREDVANDHATEVKTFGLELRLMFYREGAAVYEVNAFIHVTPADAALVALQGRASSGTGKSSAPVDKLAKEAKAFGDAGKALLKLLQTRKSDDLPWVDEKKIVPLIPARFKDEVGKSIAKSKADAAGLDKTLTDLKYDEMRIVLDEQYFSALGSDGRPRSGWIRGKLRITEDGDVTFRLSRYETK